MTITSAWTLFSWEFRYFFRNPRQILLLPLMIGGILLAMWPHIGSPFATVFLVVFLGTEREFNNILNRWPSQYAAMLLLPVDWQRAVLAKNLATLMLTILVTLCAISIVLYFAPEIPSTEHSLLALLYLLSVLFLLLAVGNARSLNSPRPGEAFDLDDLPEGVISLVTLGIASIPFGILWEILGSLSLTFLYTCAAAFYWYFFSIPKTARAVASSIMLKRVVV